MDRIEIKDIEDAGKEPRKELSVYLSEDMNQLYAKYHHSKDHPFEYYFIHKDENGKPVIVALFDSNSRDLKLYRFDEIDFNSNLGKDINFILSLGTDKYEEIVSNDDTTTIKEIQLKGFMNCRWLNQIKEFDKSVFKK
ncbi:MAG: hypothetical protein IJK15_04155 [Bacteroidaceae bacterium]|nr:hypothetical protein [Bacteroidaceae bacterium]